VIRVAAHPGAHVLFDAVAWAAGLALGWALSRWRLQGAVERVAGVTGPGYFIALVAGAIPGAWLTGSFNTLLGPSPTLSHSVAGALVGAIAGVEIYKRLRGIHGSTGGVFVGPFALGVVIGRWGCLFTGLPDRTFGLPTSLPWAVDLGDGIGRHPVQIYESLVMAAFLSVYLIALARRSPWALRRGFYALAMTYGAQRFVWEFLKPYPRLIGPLNLFHLLSAGLVIYGFAYWRGDLRRERAGGGDASV
jgi:hypothetical protein